MTNKWHVVIEENKRFCSLTGEPQHDRAIWIKQGDSHIALLSQWDCNYKKAAPLIAAAPELLEALKRVLETSTHFIGPQGDFIYAAIAKAEGRS